MQYLKKFNPYLVLNSIDLGIVTIDLDGKITYINKALEKLFNISAHESIDRYLGGSTWPWREFIGFSEIRNLP